MSQTHSASTQSPDTDAALIDTHSHLLPGVDDGCENLQMSLACARALVEEGYRQSFCTPHVWPNLPHNDIAQIPVAVRQLQAALDEHGIPLKLHPGGEMNITRNMLDVPIASIVTYGLARRYALMDFWGDAVPDYLRDIVKKFSDSGIQPILAHPERMRAIQLDPPCVDRFTELGMLLQCNLQCLGDPPRMATRAIAEKLMEENRYFMVGSDLHKLDSWPVRLAGLRRLRKAVNAATFRKLTHDHPLKLLAKASD